MRMVLRVFIFLSLLSWVGWAPLVSISAEKPDKVAELEQKIQNMEKQINEMKAVLDEQKKAISEKVAAPVVMPATPTVEAKPGPKLIGPPGTIEVGGDIRWRGRFYDNLYDFTDTKNDRSQSFRFRPRVFLDWKPAQDFEAYIRFTKEWLYGQENEGLPRYDLEDKDVTFDNAWAEYRNILDSGLSVKIGRQDLIYGEGFILLDGTPTDGSMTTSFDAVKVSYTHDWGTSDLLYAKLYEYSSIRSDDEDVYGIYNKLKFGDTGLEPYLLFKNKRKSPDAAAASFDPSPKEDTILLGMRSTHTFEVTDGVKLALAAEGGKEWGTVNFTGANVIEAANPANAYNHFGVHNLYDPAQRTFDAVGESDRDAWGGYVNAVLAFDKTVWKPSIKAGITYLSGDNPNTPDYEGWDDYYGEWPKFSELYIYSIYDGFKGFPFGTGLNDPDVGAWANMYIPEVRLAVQPTDKLIESVRYLYFGADRANGPGGGHERGHNVQWMQEYTFTKNLSGHVLVEWFKPGNYYAPDADEAWFARFQLMYKF